MDALMAHDIATQLVAALAAKKLKITTAESCTGGLIAATITDISGSSAVFDRGIVSYANSAKMELLGVSKATLNKYGAVSEQVAREMAEGARNAAGADIAISATGIAGPTGGTPEKPVGLVHIAISNANGTEAHRHIFPGDRDVIRKAATQKALELALSSL